MGPKVKFKKQKKYRNDVIATAHASGWVLRFWNALLVGDEVTVISIIDDPEYAHLIDAIYDTSDIEEWKNFRFNYRGLSMSRHHRILRSDWSTGVDAWVRNCMFEDVFISV
ncbi:ankyrin repeat and SOCS box protein 10 isoform X1 [Tachysurus ichikawai]